MSSAKRRKIETDDESDRDEKATTVKSFKDLVSVT
jgi:hypothetical protein